MELDIAVIVDMSAGLIVLSQGANDSWQLPQGTPQNTESLESAALRIVATTCQMDVELIRQVHVYSEGTKATLVFLARGRGQVQEGRLKLCHEMNLPSSLQDSSRQILRDFFLGRY